MSPVAIGPQRRTTVRGSGQRQNHLLRELDVTEPTRVWRREQPSLPNY